MKKKCILFLLLLFSFFPVLVKADMGGPGLENEAIVVKENAKYYSHDSKEDKYIVAGTLPSGTKIRVMPEYDDEYAYFGIDDYNDGDDLYGYILPTDIKLEKKLTDFSKYVEAYILKDADIRICLGEVCPKLETKILKGSLVKAYDTEYSWTYVSDGTTSGWTDNKNVIFKSPDDIYLIDDVEVYDPECIDNLNDDAWLTSDIFSKCYIKTIPAHTKISKDDNYFMYIYFKRSNKLLIREEEKFYYLGMGWYTTHETYVIALNNNYTLSFKANDIQVWYRVSNDGDARRATKLMPRQELEKMTPIGYYNADSHYSIPNTLVLKDDNNELYFLGTYKEYVEFKVDNKILSNLSLEGQEVEDEDFYLCFNEDGTYVCEDDEESEESDNEKKPTEIENSDADEEDTQDYIKDYYDRYGVKVEDYEGIEFDEEKELYTYIIIAITLSLVGIASLILVNKKENITSPGADVNGEKDLFAATRSINKKDIEKALEKEEKKNKKDKKSTK